MTRLFGTLKSAGCRFFSHNDPLKCELGSFLYFGVIMRTLDDYNIGHSENSAISSAISHTAQDGVQIDSYVSKTLLTMSGLKVLGHLW